MSNRLAEIQRLRAKRDYYARLGKRGKVSLLEAQLRGLMMREFNDEQMRAEIDRDMAIASGDLDAAMEVYRG